MRGLRLFLIVLLMAFLTNTTLYAAEDLVKLERRLQDCDEVINELMQMPDQTIPHDLLTKCAAVAIFPYMLKGGFVLGGHYGRGVVITHNAKTGEWKAPAFFTIGGASIGWQFGAQAIDLILVIMNKRGLEGLLKDKFTLGADAAVSAGPVGRNISLDTDLLMKAGVLSYSRSKGLFIGIALKGAVVAPDKKANQIYYGGPVEVQEILLGDRIIPLQSSQGLLHSLKKFSQ